MEQMDLSCPPTFQNEIFQKCRETIPQVQILFWIWVIFDCFEVISQKSESTHEILSKILAVFFAFFSARWRQNDFKTTGLFKLHQNTHFLKILRKSVE